MAYANAINKASETLTSTTVYSTTFDTNVAAAKLTIAGTTVTATGSDANVGLTITPKGSGAVTVTTGHLTLSSGNINLADTTSSSVGSILMNSERYIHAYGVDNTFLGPSAGNYTLNTTSATQGGSNVCIGKSACVALVGNNDTEATANTVCGNLALNAATSGSYNVAIGWSSLNKVTTGNYNTGIGYNSGYLVTTGSYSVFAGIVVGLNLTSSESSNILIGASNPGVNGQSNQLWLAKGTGAAAGQVGAAYCCGIYNINADSGGSPHEVYVGSGNKVGKNPSSRTVKKNIVDMTGSEVIYDLRPVNFNYISDTESQYKQYGLIAEEVAEVLPELAGYDAITGAPDSVRYEMLPILILNELKKQRARLLALVDRATALEG